MLIQLLASALFKAIALKSTGEIPHQIGVKNVIQINMPPLTMMDVFHKRRTVELENPH